MAASEWFMVNISISVHKLFVRSSKEVLWKIIVGRWFLTSLYSPPPSPHFLFFFQSPSLRLFLLPCFFGWMCDRATSNVLFYLIIWQTYSGRVLVTQYYQNLALCFIATRCQVYCRFDADNMTFANTLISISHTNKYTTRRGRTNRLTHKYILPPPVTCSQQLSVLHRINHSLITKFYFTEVTNTLLFKNCISAD